MSVFDAADDRYRRAAAAERKSLAANALEDINERIVVLLDERDRALRDLAEATWELDQLTKPAHLRYENQVKRPAS